jgi:uncharacterized membrane protein YdjX (TVP38/TMEM64 family)
LRLGNLMSINKIISKCRLLLSDFGKFGWVAVLTTVMPIFGSMLLLTVIYQIAPWLQANKEIGILVFVLFMTLFSGLALMAINVLGIVSGFAFAFQLGLLAQIFGIVGASTVMFLLSNRFASGNLLTTIERKPKIKAIHKALIKENFIKTFLIITLLRLSPAMPFAVTNFAIAAAGVSFKTFILGTLIGMTPRAVAVVFVGSSLSELDFSSPQDYWTLILGIVATILAVLIIGFFSKKALQNLTAEEAH